MKHLKVLKFNKIGERLKRVNCSTGKPLTHRDWTGPFVGPKPKPSVNSSVCTETKGSRWNPVKILSAKLFSVIILYLFIFCIASKYMYIVFLHTTSSTSIIWNKNLTEIAKIREINFVSNLFLNSDASLIVHGMKLNFSRFQQKLCVYYWSLAQMSLVACDSTDLRFFIRNGWFFSEKLTKHRCTTGLRTKVNGEGQYHYSTCRKWLL